MGEGGFSFPREELENFDRKCEEIYSLRVASIRPSLPARA
jgi:hypothetical protein